MKCKDCNYYWVDDNADVNMSGDPMPSCHYMDNDGYAPCEVKDEELYELDGYEYSYDDVRRDYQDACRECAHYGEPEPDWDEWLSNYRRV